MLKNDDISPQTEKKQYHKKKGSTSFPILYSINLPRLHRADTRTDNAGQLLLSNAKQQPNSTTHSQDSEYADRSNKEELRANIHLLTCRTTPFRVAFAGVAIAVLDAGGFEVADAVAGAGVCGACAGIVCAVADGHEC